MKGRWGVYDAFSIQTIRHYTADNFMNNGLGVHGTCPSLAEVLACYRAKKTHGNHVLGSNRPGQNLNPAPKNQCVGHY
jgi:hypothetical protein